MKKSLLLVAAVAALGIVAVVLRTDQGQSASAVDAAQSGTASPSIATSVGSSNSTSQPTQTPAGSSETNNPTTVSPSPSKPTASESSYADGTFVGASVSNPYGDVQISIAISGGKITAVNFLSYPNRENHSARINSTAVPILKQQTISSQSATIDGVSGATYTTQSYIESLQSALDKAKQA